MCRHCRAYLQQLKATLLALRVPATEQPSAAEEADLLARFNRSKP
jgi:hypothetical protein